MRGLLWVGIPVLLLGFAIVSRRPVEEVSVPIAEPKTAERDSGERTEANPPLRSPEDFSPIWTAIPERASGEEETPPRMTLSSERRRQLDEVAKHRLGEFAQSWLDSEEYEAAALALCDDAISAHESQMQLQVIFEREGVQSFESYLRAHHPACWERYATANRNVLEVLETRRQLETLKELVPYPEERVFALFDGSLRPGSEVLVLASLLEFAGDEFLRAELPAQLRTLFDPPDGRFSDRRTLATVLQCSERPWIDAWVVDWVEKREPGWNSFVELARDDETWKELFRTIRFQG